MPDPPTRPALAPVRSAWSATVLQATLVMATVLVIAIVHYHGQTLARGPDQADILLAIFHDASRVIAQEGLWAGMYTDGLRAGISNWSNPNLHLLYPLYFNWAGADASVFDTLDRLNHIIYLHLAILGGGGFVFARALGVRTLPAIAVGLVLPWFPAVRSAAAWPQIIAGMAWLPWLLACQVRLYASRGERDALPSVIGLAATATLLVYAQPAQNLVFAIVASVVAWLSVATHAVVGRDRDALRRFRRHCAWFALAAVLVLATTATYLFEVLRFHAQSIRWLGEFGGFLVGDQPVPVGALRFHSLAGDDVGLLAAFEYRKGIGNGYLGAALAVSALSLLGTAAHARQASTVRGLVICAAIATLFCFAFMAPLMVAIPVVNKVREITWWSCLAVVLVVPLAALGLQTLHERGAAVRRGVRDWRVWLFSAGFALAVLATRLSTPAHRDEAAIALVLGFAAVAWPLWSRTSAARLRDAASALVLVCAVWMPFRYNIVFARSDATLFEPDRVQAREDAAQLRELLADIGEYRISLDKSLPNPHLLTHTYAAAGFRALHGGIGPDILRKYELIAAPSPAVAALYGLKYTLWPESAQRPGDRRLRKALVLRTDPTALPRLFFIGGGLRVVDDPVATLRDAHTTTPLQALLAHGDVPADLPIAAFTPGVPTLVLPRISEDRRTRLRATFDSAGPGLLILNEDPEARWHARIDARPTQALRVNGFQTAFAIPAAGRHVVEIERPGHLFGGAP
ncbi:MAG: hypothetical protein ACREO8_00800 [Luteimonas sp.]